MKVELDKMLSLLAWKAFVEAVGLVEVIGVRVWCEGPADSSSLLSQYDSYSPLTPAPTFKR